MPGAAAEGLSERLPAVSVYAPKPCDALSSANAGGSGGQAGGQGRVEGSWGETVLINVRPVFL